MGRAPLYSHGLARSSVLRLGPYHERYRKLRSRSVEATSVYSALANSTSSPDILRINNRPLENGFSKGGEDERR